MPPNLVHLFQAKPTTNTTASHKESNPYGITRSAIWCVWRSISAIMFAHRLISATAKHKNGNVWRIQCWPPFGHPNPPKNDLTIQHQICIWYNGMLAISPIGRSTLATLYANSYFSARTKRKQQRQWQWQRQWRFSKDQTQTATATAMTAATAMTITTAMAIAMAMKGNHEIKKSGMIESWSWLDWVGTCGPHLKASCVSIDAPNCE